MSDIKQARTLFGAATRDLVAIRGMFDPEVFADEIFGFHVQQAAEKRSFTSKSCINYRESKIRSLDLLGCVETEWSHSRLGTPAP